MSVYALPIDQRCENWADCYRERQASTATAFWAKFGSSPQREHWEYGQAPPIARPGKDWLDAELVNGAWQSIEDSYHQIILGSWYVRRWSPAKCERVAREEGREESGRKLRRNGVTDHEWQAILGMAHLLLIDQITQPAVIRRTRLSDRVRNVLQLVEWRAVEAQALDTDG